MAQEVSGLTVFANAPVLHVWCMSWRQIGYRRCGEENCGERTDQVRLPTKASACLAQADKPFQIQALSSVLVSGK